ncbi:MAG: EVE domain-containing protein [Elusimicrobia bacterium]|nr:EVE domain-containing protein [Elusimicrobiota bacterium]
MKRWLIKSEPETFSLDDLANKPGRRSGWDGVRNYAARNNLKAMKAGDLAFFYHSNAKPSAVVGSARVTREAYPDGPDPRWVQVEVEYAGRLKRPVPLEDVKKEPRLAKMALVRYVRLSVQPVTDEEWRLVVKMGGGLS